MKPGFTRARQAPKSASPAVKFVLIVRVMSFFTDFTYSGPRRITGPCLGLLAGGALRISVVSGAGEFLGYNIRLFSGRGADGAGRYRPAIISPAPEPLVPGRRRNG